MTVTNHTTARVVIDDFKAGIVGDFHAGAVANQPGVTSTFDPKIAGAAVIEDTWGCCADRSGALVPLPRVTTGRSVTPDPAGSRGTNLPDNYLLDAILLDGVQGTGDSYPLGPEVVTLETWVGLQTAGAYASYLRTRRWEDWRASPQTSDIMFTRSASTADQLQLPSGNLTPVRGVDSDATLTTDDIRKGLAWVAHPLIRTGTADQFASGAFAGNDAGYTDYDTKYAGLWGDTYPARCNESIVGVFPNFGTPTFIRPAGPAFVKADDRDDYRGAYLCTAHQGRLVAAQLIPSDYLDGLVAWKDRITSSGLLRIVVPDGSNARAVIGGSGEFVEENVTGIGVMGSLSADSLLVVKHGGGGMMLRGSIAAPTVTKLPFIESTYGIISSPVATPIGLVYGTRNGVFVWEGGETTRHLSPQIDGFFWNAADLGYQGHRARFGFWHPWVMVPNGYMYDTRHQSWWRLDNPAGHHAYNVYQVSEQGRLYAFPHKTTAGVAGPLYNVADPGTKASAWSWKSQPLAETRTNAFRVRDVQILATGTDAGSTITVTVTGFDENGASVSVPAMTFNLANVGDRPQLLHLDAGAHVALTYMQVRIQGSNTTDGLAAPKLHSISLGLVDTNPIRKAA